MELGLPVMCVGVDSGASTTIIVLFMLHTLLPNRAQQYTLLP